MVVACTGSNELLVWDPVRLTVARRINLPFPPRNVVVTSDGNLLTFGQDQAAKVTSTAVKTFSHSLGWLKAACPSTRPGYSVIATSQNENMVHKLDESGVRWSAEVGSMPRGVVAIPNGAVVVACKGGNTQPGSPSAEVWFLAEADGRELRSPVEVPFGARGVVYDPVGDKVAVSSFGAQQSGDGTEITVFDAVTLAVTQVLSVPRGPFGMSVDRRGRLWVACGTDKVVVSCDLDSGEIEQMHLPWSPLSVATRGDGNEVWATYKDRDIISRIKDGLSAAHFSLGVGTASLRPETLGDWSGYTHAAFLHEYQDSNEDGATDGDSWEAGMLPFPALES